ncbi:MAG: histidine--tRNA ligase [Chitinophagales bacterium]|nr:histidine--tRNA ligase [Chitinophagales bacterium]
MSEIKKVKPSLPSGTRDFLPQEVAKRNYIFGIIKSVFEQYGFQQIETPVLENLSTLTGKYGEEGDQLLFKVLNSGDYLKDADAATLSNKDSKKLTAQIAERGLRYDLTVPLARYVVQHQNDLVFPFKRYHIAPVWRADRPQKGRYREFYQCDADIIGSNSLLNEVELTYILHEVFKKLNINVTIRFNHREILMRIAHIFYKKELESKSDTSLSKDDFYSEFIKALDKIDKVGVEGVNKEFADKGFDLSNLEFLWTFIKRMNEAKTVAEKYAIIKELLNASNVDFDWKAVYAGLDIFIEDLFEKFESLDNVKFDFTLARGLDYYTGTIWEVVSNDVKMGSIAAGGRYANLTEMFGGRDMSGVGISFGVERIYDIMEELKLFPQDALKTTKVLFVHFSEANRDFAFPLVQQLREANVSVELYPDKAKMEKQMKYANAKGIPYVVVIGDNEMQSGKLTVKDMRSGTQEEKTFAELLSFFTAKQ